MIFAGWGIDFVNLFLWCCIGIAVLTAAGFAIWLVRRRHGKH